MFRKRKANTCGNARASVPFEGKKEERTEKKKKKKKKKGHGLPYTEYGISNPLRIKDLCEWASDLASR